MENIKNRFIDNRESYERLYTMIQEDTKAVSCFAVGTGHIGGYWEHNQKWNTTQNYDRKISLTEVLKEVGLSSKRYNEYLSLFEKTGAEEIGCCPRPKNWVQIIVTHSGLAISGCLTSINKNEDGSVPKTDIQPGYSSRITPITNGWYINHDCT